MTRFLDLAQFPGCIARYHVSSTAQCARFTHAIEFCREKTGRSGLVGASRIKEVRASYNRIVDRGWQHWSRDRPRGVGFDEELLARRIVGVGLEIRGEVHDDWKQSARHLERCGHLVNI
jgi:hypothetical protein